jgi:16S rRNA (uracil1498-N3)-methyltransferase
MRQFVLSRQPDSSGAVLLGDKEYRYLVQVLRKSTGDAIEARLPDGTLCIMRVASIDRKEKQIRLILASRMDDASGMDEASCAAGVSMPPISALGESFPTIVLFQWMLKGPKMDQVIRQATEAGVSVIVPVAGERCLSSNADDVGGGKTGRWDRIVREALQQCGSPVPTKVLSPVDSGELPSLWQSLGGPDSRAIVLTEAPLARISLHEYLCSGTGATAIAIGPEGGMTAREIGILEESGFTCIHFKTNILRAETAALYGIAAVQSALLEFENWQLKESIS